MSLRFSFVSSSGSGFEAFITESGILTVAILIKKEYHSVAIPDHPITDNLWVST